MYATERHDRIRSVIASAGRVSVADLSQQFRVTPETVRRDLDLLEQHGLLRRVHGGAIAWSKGSVAEPSVRERHRRDRSAKDAIALAAMRMLPETFTGSVVLDAGTTTAALAELLAGWRPAAPGRSLAIITNSVPVAATLHTNPHLDVHLLGGRIRGVTSAAVGTPALAQLAQLRPDIAFVGANGVSAGFGLSTPDELEAAVKAAIVRAARRTVALVDASKLGEETLVRFAALNELDTLITNREPDVELAFALEAAAVEVIVA